VVLVYQHQTSTNTNTNTNTNMLSFSCSEETMDMCVAPEAGVTEQTMLKDSVASFMRSWGRCWGLQEQPAARDLKLHGQLHQDGDELCV
jgi:hypothetical protein